MKDKIIIHNYTELEDLDVINKVAMVVSEGKCSQSKYGEQYCFATTFSKRAEEDKRYTVLCDRHNETYTFKVVEEE